MTNQPTILVIEKDPVLALHATRLLEAAGYTTLQTASGEQALQMLSGETSADTEEAPSNAPAIDLALTGIHLGSGMDGLQLAQEIRRLKDIPVVYASAYRDAEMVARAEAISPYGYLLQPYSEHELTAAIRLAFRLHAALLGQRSAEQALEQAAKERELALREQRRRIADSLAMAASLLDLSVEELPDEQARRVFYHARARLRPFTALYDPLNRRGEGRTDQDRIDMGAYFLDLTADLAHFYDWVSYRVNLSTRVDELLLEVRHARSLGLILIELLVHVFDYAFPPGSGGAIQVGLERTTYGALLRVHDDGITARPPLPDMSRTLIEYLARPLAGRFNYEIGSHNVTASLAFRISDV